MRRGTTAMECGDAGTVRRALNQYSLSSVSGHIHPNRHLDAVYLEELHYVPRPDDELHHAVFMQPTVRRRSQVNVLSIGQIPLLGIFSFTLTLYGSL